MYNQSVTYSGGAWGYSPIKYFSNDANDRYSFYGYAPYSSNAAANGRLAVSAVTATPSITYTIDPTDLASTVDLVAGQQISYAKPATSGTAVTINMKHQTTRLSVTAKTKIEDATADGKTSVIIKKIYFDHTDATAVKFPVSGVYTFGDATTENTTATDHTGDGSWVTTGATTDFDFNGLLDDAKKNDAIGTNGTNVKQYPADRGVQVSDDASVVSLFADNNYAFLIPPASTTGNFKLVIDYDIITVDDALDGDYTFSSNQATFTLAATDMFQQGKAYNFALEFTLRGVMLTASVAGWDNGTDPTVVLVEEAEVVTTPIP